MFRSAMGSDVASIRCRPVRQATGSEVVSRDCSARCRHGDSVHDPVDAEALTKLNPAGSASVTTTAAAFDGPAFRTSDFEAQPAHRGPPGR